MAGTCFGQTQKPCFAFLLKGDVDITCEGAKTQITHHGDIDEFAVSNEHSSLGFVTSRTTKPVGGVSDAVYTTSMIELRSGKITQIAGENALVSTCGSIFWPWDRARDHFGNRDLITGEEITMPPYAWFRCSSDRKTVVGAVKNTGTDLMQGTADPVKVAEAGAFNFYQFNLSPDGSKVVYTSGGHPLCVAASPGVPSCVAQKNVPNVPSVNDAGEVLVAAGTGEECFYKSASSFSTVRAGGAKSDECLGIGYWKSGLKAVEIIEPLGRNPQWISPTTAKLMREWAAHEVRDGK
jgi:hypothetical protein